MRKRANLSTILLSATENVIASTTDFLLFSFYTFFINPDIHSYFAANRTLEEASAFVEEVNYKRIKRAFNQLIKNGMITKSKKKRSSLEIAITELGKQRIAELIPQYRTKRPWDGYIYLISYDIPTKANYSRNILRSHLQRIGCALLQESLWMTPYNPSQLLEEFTEEHHIPGTLLVSKLGKDGAIGEEAFASVINRVYHLDDLANEYEEFINAFTSEKSALSSISVGFSYYAILKKDPQLPFELLPKDFPGQQAYEAYHRLTKIK